MKYRTLEQNARLHALITKLGIDTETKAQLVAEVSKGRVTSSKLLTERECEMLISHLSSMPAMAGTRYGYVNDPANKMRRKILSICHELEWELQNGSVDWPRLNAWLLKYGYLHKGLNEYTEQELPTLVTQFENLLRTSYASKKDKAGT